MHLGSRRFAEVWFLDFEFNAKEGDPPSPICLVAREFSTGRLVRAWEDELRRMPSAPFATDDRSLLVAYYASAEVGCFFSLGWNAPRFVLDLFTEFRALTNGQDTPCGSGLVGALTYYGLGSIGAVEKDTMRQLALRGGPWTDEERRALLDYCQSDVDALERLFPTMLPLLDGDRSLLRGRFMVEAARIERVGVPIDVRTLHTLRDSWDLLKSGLVARLDHEYGVYDGTTFKADRWADWCAERRIAWPRLGSGRLALDDDTFRSMAVLHPEVGTIRYVRSFLSQLRLHDLSVGADGRNRCLLSAFRSKTGRNQPSNSRFVFGLPSWLRPLMQAEPGLGIAYVDWEQQEFGIAAALSGDVAMRNAYESGDPYLAFAKQARAAPPSATKSSHAEIRTLYKQCALAVQYCMGPDGLSKKIGRPIPWARDLLDMHRKTYLKFWRWSDAAVDMAMLYGKVHTSFGWTLHQAGSLNQRTLRNFPMQANGAEMLRLACILASERGVRVCAPVHDALLIEAPVASLDETIHATRAAMAEASRLVLDGFVLRTDVSAYPHPLRFAAERGAQMWKTVMHLLADHGTSLVKV